MFTTAVRVAKEEIAKVLESPAGPVIREAIGGIFLGVASALITVATEKGQKHVGV